MKTGLALAVKKWSLSKRNIATGVVFFACAGAIFAASVSLSRSELRYDPWVDFPKSGMDASSYFVRTVIIYSSYGEHSHAWNGSQYTLAGSCGNWYEDGLDRYGVTIGRWNKSYRQAAITIEDKYAEVEFSTREIWPLLEKRMPMPNDNRSTSEDPPQPRKVVRIPIKKLSDLRAAWVNENLWHAPQADFDCRPFDNVGVLLEACIDGKYAARFRHCQDEDQPYARVFESEFDNLFPNLDDRRL
jgi:hypothetical protein